jgi:acetyl-CoA carboxylase biotin carboxyl carrier protein
MLPIALLAAPLGHGGPPIAVVLILGDQCLTIGRSSSNAIGPDRCGSMDSYRGTSIGEVRGVETIGVEMAEDVRAEIVASVLEVVVHEGDRIGEGDTLVLLESMKMEIPVLAEVAGTVSSVNVAVGDVIQAGDLIAVID